MANKKISELQSRTPALSDLMLVGDPSSGYSYKCTVTALATIIETDIADGYVTIGTTQTISGAKTFSNNLTLTSVANATTTQTKFLTLNASNVVNYRTGAEVLADIGGQGTISLAAIGSTPNANGATLSSNTLTLQPASASFGGVLTTGFQEIAGWKRFTGNPIQFDNHLEIKNLNSWGVSWGYTSFASKDTPVFGFLRGHSSTGSVTYNAWFTYGTTGDRNYTLPSSDGTLALTSQVPTVSGTTNYVAKFTSSSAIGNSQIFDNGTSVGINTATPNEKLEVSGVVRVSRTTSASAYLNLTIENGVAGFDARGSIDQVFYTGALERMRIGFGGDVTISTIANATVDTDKFLVSDSGVIKYRTGSEVLSDIGAASSSSISGTTNYIPKFTSSSAIGNSVIYESGGSINIIADGSNATFTNGGQLAIKRLNNNPYLSFHDNAGARIGYLQMQATGATTFANEVAQPMLFSTNATERMRLDASGNLGLGTTPYTWTNGRSLDIQGTNFSSITLNSSNGSSRNWGIASNYNAWGDLVFFRSTSANVQPSSIQMTLDIGGNLGLGVTPSAWSVTALQVKSASIFEYSNNNVSFGSNIYFDGSNRYISSTSASNYQQTGGAHYWYTAPSGTAGNAISFTQAMTLDASGRLGIGTTSPNYLLDLQTTSTYVTNNLKVNASAAANNYAEIAFQLWSGAGSGENVFGGSGTSRPSAVIRALSEDNAAKGALLFATFNGGATNANLTEKMRITSGGEVLIAGTYNPYTTANRGNITLNGTSSNIIAFTDNSTVKGYFYHSGTDIEFLNNTSTGTIKFFTNGGNERMRITSGGEVYIAGTTDQGAYNLQVNGTGVWGAGAYVNGSDSALKQNIQPLDNSLDLVKQMKPVTYNYKESYSKDTSVQTGFIAQDLQELLKNKNYLNGIVKDGTYLSVAYQNLIPLLVKAIQEQQLQIENLKNK